MAVFFEEPGEDFLYQHSTTSSLQDEVVECWYTKSSPDWNEGHCQSLPALLFRTLRTLADSRTKDAKYHGSNLNYKLDKKVPMVFVWHVQHFGMHAALWCGRRWALEVWWLCCVALPCNSHATHTQHTVNTTRNTSKFSIKVRVVCQNLIFAFKDRILGQPLEIRTFIENLQHFSWKVRVVCQNLIFAFKDRILGCVDCVLRVCCMWVAWQGHATQPSYFQSPAPATRKSSMRPKVLHLPHKYHRNSYQICNSDCCHDILHPLSYCQPMSWAFEKVVLAETDNALRFSPGSS